MVGRGVSAQVRAEGSQCGRDSRQTRQPWAEAGKGHGMCLQVTAEWLLGDQVLLYFSSCSILGGPDLHPGAREEGARWHERPEGTGLKTGCPAGLAPRSSAGTVSPAKGAPHPQAEAEEEPRPPAMVPQGQAWAWVPAVLDGSDGREGRGGDRGWQIRPESPYPFPLPLKST